MRNAIGHVHIRRHTASGGGAAFRGDVGLVGQARLTEMDVAVDHAWKQVKTSAVNHLVERRKVAQRTLVDLGNQLSFYHHVAQELPSFVHDGCVMYDCSHSM